MGEYFCLLVLFVDERLLFETINHNPWHSLFLVVKQAVLGLQDHWLID
jgi:hypothetical protein